MLYAEKTRYYGLVTLLVFSIDMKDCLGLGKVESCLYGSRRYSEGAIWRPNRVGVHRCRLCRCMQGRQVICWKNCRGQGRFFPPSLLIQDGSMSSMAHGNNGDKRPCRLDAILYQDGENWIERGPHARKLTHSQCMECNCASQVVTCAIRTCPSLSCLNSISQKGTCCKTCKGRVIARPPRASRDCTSIGRNFKDYERWKLYLPSKNVFATCFDCECRDGKETCRKHYCPAANCPSPRKKPSECCALCPGQRYKPQNNNGRTFTRGLPGGDSYFPILASGNNKQNQHKSKLAGQKTVQGNNGGQRQRSKGKRDCEFGRKVYRDNAFFHPELESLGRQKCMKCVCMNIVVKCGKVQCPDAYPCAAPENRKGLCCKICPGMSNVQAHKLEQIQMYKNRGCSKVKPSHIQVYKYNEKKLNLSNDKYLFDRSHQPTGKTSEIHSIKLINHSVAVTRVHLTNDEATRQFLDVNWESIGSIKERVFHRILRNEVELASCRIRSLCARKLNHLNDQLKTRASRRRMCRSSTVIQSLHNLEEGG